MERTQPRCTLERNAYMEYTVTCSQNDPAVKAIRFFNTWLGIHIHCKEELFNGSAILHKRGRGNMDD